MNHKDMGFYHDNAKILWHLKKLKTFPYSSNLSPSDDYSFKSLQNHLDGQVPKTHEVAQSTLHIFFSSLQKLYYKACWEEVFDEDINQC